MAKISLFVWACSLFCLALCPGFLNSFSAYGQGIITGALTGFIQDSSGAVVPNVPIMAVNNSTGAVFRASTGSDGTFTLRDLPIGDYNVNRRSKTSDGFNHGDSPGSGQLSGASRHHYLTGCCHIRSQSTPGTAG